MVISEKQHQANRENTQHSTVRLNALKYGFRAQDMLLPGEDPSGYMQLWEDLVADWQPANRTERLHLEQMCINQWLLSRVAWGEHLAFAAPLKMLDHFSMLILIAKYKAL